MIVRYVSIVFEDLLLTLLISPIRHEYYPTGA